jgi:hypothetical protein
MTYSSAGLIQATDYNGFASTTAGANVNDVWGVGATDKGWGQSTTLSTVSAAGTVGATEWAALVSRISSMGSQTATAITARTGPTVGETIGILAAVNTDLTSCTTNRGFAAASGTTSSTWTGSTAKTSVTGTGQAAWTMTFTHVVTFPSAAEARYFWNAGGLIRLDFNKSSTGTDSDADWNTFAGTMGALYLSGRVNSAAQTIAGQSYTGFTRIGGSGTPNTHATTTGWYSLTADGVPTTMFKLFSAVSPYTGNYIQVTAAKNAGLTTATFVTTWVSTGTAVVGSTANISGGTDTASPYTAFGTAPAVLCRYIPPSTTYLTNTWGTPTIAGTVA